MLSFITLASAQPQAKSKFQQRVDSVGNFGASFDNFVKEVNSEYESFRDKVNAEYADFMKRAWIPIPIEEEIPVPIEKKVPPVIYDENKEKEKRENDTIVVITHPIIIDIDTVVKPQPKPIAPIRENDLSVGYDSINFYGTTINVRLGDLRNFRLENTSEESCANAYLELTDKGYNNLIRDCLELRIKRSLCDWAYYQMLKTITTEACGKSTNEATFALGVLLSQSGYKIRFGREENTNLLQIMINTDSRPYGKRSMMLDNEIYNLIETTTENLIYICQQKYPGEQPLSLKINALPILENNPSELRDIKGMLYSMEAQSNVNKNLLDFFEEYPSSYVNDDFMTRWVYYANTPLSNELKTKLYPQLKQRLGKANQKMAGNMLLSWVQTGLEYEFDDKVWGRDRAFFGEETLYYPFCDCEDRSILFSHLVRDLLGLDVLLVYYPGHLATAVEFTEPIDGDYVIYNNRKFTICDPTYIGAGVGRTMLNMDNATATVILLDKGI